MRVRRLTYLWTIPVVLLLLCTDIRAQNAINAMMGVDFHAISSSSESHDDSYSTIDATRFLSNHFVSFANNGNIKSEEFANYSLFTKLRGSFAAINASEIDQSTYAAPSLNALMGNIGFFPRRSYNLNLFYAKMTDVGLRFDKSYRSSTGIIYPGLAILQKGQTDSERYGTTFSSNLFEGASIEGEYNTSTTGTQYDYDFGEDKNLTITTREYPGDIYTNTVPISFNNKIKDDSVRIVSGIINEIIPPGFTTTIIFDSGYHFIDIIPLHTYNQSSTSINAHPDQRFVVTIEADEYPAKDDVTSETNSSRVEFDYKRSALALNTSYSSTNASREATGTSDDNTEIKNRLKYDLSRKLTLMVNTENTESVNTSSNLSEQIATNFANTSSLSFRQRTGIGGTFGHYYRKASNSGTTEAEETTTDTKYTSMLSLPLRKNKHTITLSGALNLQNMAGTSSSDATNRSLTLANRMELSYKNIKWKPVSSVTLSSNEKTTDSLQAESKGISLNSSLEGSRLQTRFLGDITSTIRHSHVRNTADSKTSTSSALDWQLRFSKDISDKQSITFSTSHSWKFTGDATVELVDSVTLLSTITTLSTPTQYSNATSFGYNSTQFEDFTFSTGLSISNASQTSTVAVNLSLETYIPFIRFPLSTRISQQYRSLEGMPGQTSFKMESLISYRFSQISLRITHLYTKEKLVRDTYKFYELSVSITRTFGVL